MTCSVLSPSCITIVRNSEELHSLDEANIVALVRAGNRDAFAEIVTHYQAPITRYLYRMTGDYAYVSERVPGSNHCGVIARQSRLVCPGPGNQSSGHPIGEILWYGCQPVRRILCIDGLGGDYCLLAAHTWSRIEPSFLSTV